MFSRWMLCGAFTLTLAWAAQAQDPSAATEPEKPKFSGTTEGTAGDAAQPSAAQPVDAGFEADPEFKQEFDAWRGVIQQMRKLQLEYKAAEPNRRLEIEQEFNQLRDQGDAMVVKLKEMAETRYQADPQKHIDSAQFLATMGVYAFNRDQYEEALRIFQLLINNNYPNKLIYNFAGIAAFILNDVDKADEYLKIADEASQLTEDGKNYQLRLEEFRPAWEAEKATREKEAQADDLPRVKLTTDKGDIVVELFENEAPNTVANFISLVEKGFYNGTPFHRVLEHFMAQGGDPKGDGTGGPGYRIPCECVPEKFPNYRKHFRGSLSMAKEEAVDTGGSQFYITFVPTSHLDGKHTVFGRVIEGMDVVDRIQRRDPEKANPPTPDKIVKAEVIRKRSHEYKPTTLPESPTGRR